MKLGLCADKDPADPRRRQAHSEHEWTHHLTPLQQQRGVDHRQGGLSSGPGVGTLPSVRLFFARVLRWRDREREREKGKREDKAEGEDKGEIEEKGEGEGKGEARGK